MATPNTSDVREWWHETPPSSSLPPPSPQGIIPPMISHIPNISNQTRRRGQDHIIENVMLPPRPSECSDFHDISFMDDEAFSEEDHLKKSRFSISMMFPGLRRSLKTVALLIFLVVLGFLLGYEVREKFSSSSSSSSSDGSNYRRNEVGNTFQPICGSEFVIKNGNGYGGHNLGLGCVNAGRLTWGACIKIFEKRSQCTAATYKDNECWLHDRHQDVCISRSISLHIDLPIISFFRFFFY